MNSLHVLHIGQWISCDGETERSLWAQGMTTKVEQCLTLRINACIDSIVVYTMIYYILHVYTSIDSECQALLNFGSHSLCSHWSLALSITWYSIIVYNVCLVVVVFAANVSSCKKHKPTNWGSVDKFIPYLESECMGRLSVSMWQAILLNTQIKCMWACYLNINCYNKQSDV